MLNYFKSILFSRSDQDPAYINLVQIVLLIATLAFFAIAVVLIFPLQNTEWTTVWFALIVAILSGLSLYFSYHNVLWPGKLVLPLAGLLAVTAIAVTSDGMHDTAIVGFSLVIVITSLITGQNAIPVVTILTLLGIWTVTFADMTGINHSSMAVNTGWADVANVSIMQILVAGALYALLSILNRSIDRAQANEQAQVVTNQELRRLQAGLEQRVIERTRNLELAVEVGRSVSQVGDLKEMLLKAAEIICSSFDLYYVQVYLVDQTRTSLVLQSGTGAVGADLVSRGHSLPLNSVSINGRSAVEKSPVLVDDTNTSAFFRPNPLLPETCSEMAVPLMVGENVVGVLDLQSNQSGTLNRDVLPAFETLAGQLAIAIQNSNLLEEAERSRAQVENQARRLVRTGWQDYLDALHKPEKIGFAFEQNQVVQLDDAAVLPTDAATFSVPIVLSGEALGTLAVDIDESRRTGNSTELMTVVARQVAQQIENLRLLDSAERYRYEAEQNAHLLTRQGWQEYREANSDKSLGFMYDLNQVKPQEAIEAARVEKTTVSLPLKVNDETVGKVVVLGLDEHDEEGLSIARSVADRLSERIESLRQFQQTQSALGQSEKLFEASRQLTLATDLKELLDVTVKALNIPVINRALLASVTFAENKGFESALVAANWWSGSGLEPAPVGLRMSGSLSMFATPEPLFLNDSELENNLEPAVLAVLKQQNVRSAVILPLFLGTRQIGTLVLESEQPHKFTPDEIRLITSLAPQVSTVWENRRQFERAQRQAEREATLNAINQKIQSATSVDAVLQIAARELGHALGAPRTIAQLSLKESK
jgi:GAF domain-containing protein